MADFNKNSENLSAKLLILLVENDPEILKARKNFLESLGLQVDIAINALETIHKFKRYPYPLVILDGDLPDIDGETLSRRLREYEKSESRLRTPFILLSTYNQDSAEQGYDKGNIDTYAIKSLRPLILKNLVLEHLNRVEIHL